MFAVQLYFECCNLTQHYFFIRKTEKTDRRNQNRVVCFHNAGQFNEKGFNKLMIYSRLTLSLPLTLLNSLCMNSLYNQHTVVPSHFQQSLIFTSFQATFHHEVECGDYVSILSTCRRIFIIHAICSEASGSVMVKTAATM